MFEKLRQEWEEHFGKDHDFTELKGKTVDESGQFVDQDGHVTPVWTQPTVDSLNEMITGDWNRFLTESDVYRNLSEEEKVQLKIEGPKYENYSGD